jgi:hypothetical protein
MDVCSMKADNHVINDANDRLLNVLRILTKSKPHWLQDYMMEERRTVGTSEARLDYRTRHLKVLVEEMTRAIP